MCLTNVWQEHDMAIIKKKIWPEYFDLVVSGKKKFEMRLADFEINEGDTLLLQEWDPKKKLYTGREVEKKAGYIAKFKLDAFGQEQEMKEKGIQIITLE